MSDMVTGLPTLYQGNPNIELQKNLKSNLSKMKNRREIWEDIWQDVADFVCPRRELMDRLVDQDEMRVGTEIFDGTGVSAAEILTDGLQGNLVSRAIKWFRLIFEQLRLMDLPGARGWLEQVEDHLYSVFRRSSFYEAVHELLLDGVTIGTATMYLQENFEEQIPMFTTLHPKEIYIAEDVYGRVDMVYRTFKWTIKQLVERYGMINARIKEWHNNDPFHEVELLHAVQPRRIFDQTKIDSKNMPWASYVMLMDAGLEEDNQLLEESGFRQMPYMVWRYRKNSDEEYGRSPASDAISDIKRSNQFSKTMLEAAQKSVEPPMQIPEEMRARVDFGPDGRNYYEDASRLIHPLMDRLNYPVGVDREERLQEIIERHFRVDFFLMLARAEKTMTATEILQRQNEKATLLGPAVGRLTSELLEPVIERVYWMEVEAGRIPPPPPALLAVQNGRLDVDFLGPLAQAQRKHFSSQGALQSMEVLAPLFAIFPEARDTMNADEVAMALMKAFGMPAAAMRSPEEIAGIRQQRMQQLMAQQQAERLESVAKAVPQLNEPVQPDSILSEVQGRLGG